MLSEEFWKFVFPVTESGCWIWMGSLNLQGYGQYTNRRRLYSSKLAHRISYEDRFGPIKDGLVLDHLCRIPCCINPDHQEPVTTAINLSRGFGAAYQHRNKTHCKYGHSMDDAYLSKARDENGKRTGPKIWRDCRTCHRLRYERKKKT